MNGIVISQVAEQRPEKIDELVYLSAFLLPSGKSAIEASQEDAESVILKSVEMDEAQGKVTLTEEGMKDALYHDCPQEDFERAGRLISPQPLALFGTPVQLTEVFEGVRRTYVHTTQDRALSPSAQERMFTELPCEKVVSMAAGHLPFFAAPEELS